MSNNDSYDNWVDSENSNSISGSISDEDDDVDETQVDSDKVVSSSFLDQLILKLMNAKPPRRGGTSHRTTKSAVPISIIPVELTFQELTQLCDMAIESFRQQKSLLTFEKEHLPLVVCADLHGHFQDLREIFVKCGSPHHQNYLFLGDYVDRGTQGLQTLALLLALKVKYPTKVFLLRGNHEDIMSSLSYGFYDECQYQFVNAEENYGEAIYNKLLEVFNWIPFAAVIDKTIFCVHGGLSPHLDKLESIEQIVRPCIVPPYGLACDLVWSDPICDPEENYRNGWSMSGRGISFTFGQSVVDDFCTRTGIDLIVRGHQLVKPMLKNGYNFFGGGRVLTLFSARNYMNFGNASSVLRVDPELNCRFIVFKMRKARTKEPKTERPRLDTK
ncbi:calcineurin-like phosphoesterase domain-containing protein [Ditylenchus destructor]|uniref:Serine/threonine-protein phosphatase n=1 Tax=Ditylenchus destructor TaxID=166010 RepID=A0AAD4NCM1_9BILA|nr:calcineurin-like phosphoesterase domain-containing protein [Ditylenchus destructor]